MIALILKLVVQISSFFSLKYKSIFLSLTTTWYKANSGFYLPRNPVMFHLWYKFQQNYNPHFCSGLGGNIDIRQFINESTIYRCSTYLSRPNDGTRNRRQISHFTHLASFAVRILDLKIQSKWVKITWTIKSKYAKTVLHALEDLEPRLQILFTFVCKKVPGKITDKYTENLKQASGEI